MLAVERHRHILRLLKENGTVRTMEVANRLKVTQETVRKDFEYLEKDRVLVRIHGGAVRPSGNPLEVPLVERKVINIEAKKEIAQEAAKLVDPDQTLYIDASSTALQLAIALPEIPLRVITNAHDVVAVLTERSQMDVLVVGGRFDRISRSSLGRFPESLKIHNIQRAFISGNGLDPDRGVSEVNEAQALLKRDVIEIAEEVCVLADHSKLGLRSRYFFGEVDSIHELVTDTNANEIQLEKLRNRGLRIHPAD